jgi:glycosyltransferase involved in cell wall biosynthesis
VSDLVTVAIPVRDGATMLEQTLGAVNAQRLAPGLSLELIVCDSGSRDGSVAIARGHGADVIEIPAESFSHGETRNLLMRQAQGEHVAFLTQDAVPADELWLATLLGGFALAEDVGLAFGPYLPRADASPMVARELTEWFRSFSPDASPRIDRLDASDRDAPVCALLGPRGFFTDANGCVARSAWESVPFRRVAYAEDHALAHDMLRFGLAKAYVPKAAVIHSHEYSEWDWLRRSFDESRALREVYGFAPSMNIRTLALQVWGLVGADRRWDRRTSPHRPAPWLLVRSLRHHALRTAGALFGARADRLPEAVVRRLSLEAHGDGKQTGLAPSSTTSGRFRL